MAPRKCVLEKHQQCDEHTKRLSAASSCRRLVTVPVGDTVLDVKRIEIELSVAVTCHCAIVAIDHLGEIISKNGGSSNLSRIRLHRTKCSQIIQKVVSPSLLSSLKSDMKGKKYSLLIDESTDISSQKHLCICARYFSDKEQKVMTAFVNLVPVVETTGESLFLVLTETLAYLELPITDCIGFGCDGASSMVGVHNSVWSRLKHVSPHCIQMKCICHSLALCVQHAFEKLPSNLGFLLHEIPKWFSKSSLRRESFKQLFEVMDPQSQRADTAPPFQQPSSTRWLVRGKVVKNLLGNWEELVAYFTCTQHSGTADVRYKARMILNMLNDRINYFYFLFVSPIVSEFEGVNSFFQANDADPDMMLQELNLHANALRNRLFDASGRLLPAVNTDFGAKFIKETTDYVSHHPGSSHLIEELKMRCHAFLEEAYAQVVKRLPDNRHVFRNLANLHPRKVLSQTDRVPFEKLPFRFLLAESEDKIEQQYRKVIHVIWSEQSAFRGQVPSDTVQFWSGVRQYVNGLGEKSFRELASYALSCLVVPISNAVVERVFSQVTCIKTKQRNSMSLEMLDAIVRIRAHLSFRKHCCRDFIVHDDMIQRFTAQQMYLI